MVSTYLSYDLVNRDMPLTLSRLAAQNTVVRDAQYYKDNIGKVTDIDGFLGDYKLYTYAMTAHGLEDMIYAKAFMKKVLESDLNDSNSYANLLTDERYRNFAASFNFNTTTDTPVAQSSAQMDELIGLYGTTVAASADAVSEETRYYKAMASQITSADQLLRNDRLREYVFTTYGIDGSTYSYAMAKGALTSDRSDPNSYYNTTLQAKLTVKQSEYDALKVEDAQLVERTTAISTVSTLTSSITAGETAIANLQSEIDALEQQKADGGNAEELQVQIDAKLQAKSDRQVLVDADRATQTTTQARIDELNTILVPVADTTTRRTAIATLVSEFDTSAKWLDPFRALADNFQFNADGSVPAGGFQTDAQRDSTVTDYLVNQPRLTQIQAMSNRDYALDKLRNATTVDSLNLATDKRLFTYIASAFNLNEVYIVPATIEQILVNSGGIVEKNAADRPQYKELYEAFNFNADGTANGVPQTTAQLNSTASLYMSRYDDKQEAADEKAVSLYKTAMSGVTSLETFMSTTNIYSFALKAVGLDPDTVSTYTIKNALKSDLSDPNSFVYKLNDPRYVTLVEAFNFTKTGGLGTPVTAQSSTTITDTAKSYIVNKTKFLDTDAKEVARTAADAESSYYTGAMQGLKTSKEFLEDRRLVDFVLTAKGIDPTTVTDDFMKQIFASDLEDPKSFANQQTDTRFAEIFGTFNFDSTGNLDRNMAGQVQNKGEMIETEHLYLRQMLETEQGNENAGVRLALYFQRMAGTVTDAYAILGDEALLEFFRVTFSLPAELGNMDVDQQAKIVTKNLDLNDLLDEEKLSKLVNRFTIMYDLENGAGSDPSLSILMGSSGSAGISADTLFAISQLG